MSETIPAIIPKNFAELKEKIKLVEPYVKTVQIDMMDGIFVGNTTWPFDLSLDSRSGLAQGKPSIRELEDLQTNLEIEAHLMVEAPHRVLNEWLNSKVNRIILHWEALEKIHNHEILPYKTQVGAGFPVSNLAEEIHKNNKQLGIALNLETPISVLDNFIDYIDMVLLMSVEPGRGGQQFQEKVIPKLISLRQKSSSVKIEVDGGINLQNVFELAKSGADYLVVGSAIFENRDPVVSVKNLNILLAEK